MAAAVTRSWPIVLGLLVAFGMVFGLSVQLSRAAATCTQQSPTRKVCRVDQPVVGAPSHAYPEIVYAPGDVITIDAGGCVQTGGSGKTWKRYVDPSGSHTDRLYHGLIWLPGATNGLQRIGVAHQTFSVAANVPAAQTFLRLGYEDDDYGDNGFWGHDDGTDDQCRNVGDAFVVLTIDHIATPPATPAPLPLDLVPAGFDDNGLALNPGWFYERTGALRNVKDICANRTVAQCTHSPVGLDTPGFLKEIAPFLCTATSAGTPSSWDQIYSKQGHTNWSTGTFYGSIFFNNHSGSDDDYDLSLVGLTATGVPLTFENAFVGPGSAAHGTHVEFDSDETIDHFHTNWWSAWHDAVDNDSAKAHAMVDGSDAVVVGLVGLDCVHDCLSEIHPAYALAMRVPDHPAGIDRWALFVRNSGDEGFCSQNQHYLETSRLALRLHPPAGADSFSIAASDLKTNDSSISLAVDGDGHDAVVIVNLPIVATMERLNGTIDLTWHMTSMTTRSAHLNTLSSNAAASSKARLYPVTPRHSARVWIPYTEPDATAEVRLAAAVARLPAAARATLPYDSSADAVEVIARRRPGALAAFRSGHERPIDSTRLTTVVAQRYIARLDAMCRTLQPVDLAASGLSAGTCAAISHRRPLLNTAPAYSAGDKPIRNHHRIVHPHRSTPASPPPY